MSAYNSSRTYGSYRSNRGSFPRTTRPASYSAPSLSLPPDRDIMEGLNVSSLIKTIDIPKITQNTKEVEIENVKYIGSYNWVKDSEAPEVLVPGAPAEWQDMPTPYQVPADVGVIFVDQNSYRMPSSALLSLLIAVDETEKDDQSCDSVDWPGLDIVTDRNGLRKLMRWIAGGNPKDFRIDLQLAGSKAVLFNRWEKRYRENFSGYTFGFNFEKASTEPAAGCEMGGAHHRIVKYEMNGLKMVVRFEVDACMPAPLKTGKPITASNVDDLSAALAGIEITKTPAASTSTSYTIKNGLKVMKAGHSVPQSSIIELTTVSRGRAASFDWKEKYPQLFLSQTPLHFLGIHERGRFVSIEKRGLMDSTLRSVKNSLQTDFKKLRAALEIIQKLVIERGQRGRLSLVCVSGVLKVYERKSQASCLPDEFMARFDA